MSKEPTNRTQESIIECITNALEDLDTEPAMGVAEELLGVGELDTTDVDVNALCADIRLQAAFRKFVAGVISAFEMVEDD